MSGTACRPPVGKADGLHAIMVDLMAELADSEDAFEAMTPGIEGYEVALGQLADRRGRIMTQLTLVGGMLKERQHRADRARRRPAGG